MKARYLLSTLADYPNLKDPQGNPLPEIALVGRSNVGKSSLINHLLQQKKLAKTLATPGKTRLLNFFLIDERFLLVDLPGYGYAKAPKSEIETWSHAIEAYIHHRPTLRLVLLLVDSRRGIGEEDQKLIDWAHHRRLKFLLIFTKTDKLYANELGALQKKYPEAIFYSTMNNHSRHIAEKRIEQILWG